MGAPRTERHNSALDLDRWILAGRPSEHPVTEHAASCEPCRARLEAPGVAEPGLEPSDEILELRVDAIFKEAEARRAGPLARLADMFRGPWALATASAAATALGSLESREPGMDQRPSRNRSPSQLVNSGMA